MLEDHRLLEHPSVVRVEEVDGALTYVVAAAPDALSPVTERDLARAWDAATSAVAAATGRRGLRPFPACRFRFEHRDGCLTELALPDDGRSARAWADAGEGIASLRTFYGVSLCLRLLALSAVLAPTGRTAIGAGKRRRSSPPPPSKALLRAAAQAPLTAAGGFDEGRLRTLLAKAAPLAKESRA